MGSQHSCTSWRHLVCLKPRALLAASAVVMAKEYGVGLKVIWRLEEGCGDACGNPGFNSSWPDLFSEPKLRLVDNFPGELSCCHEPRLAQI